MADCPFCEIKNCPILNRDQCPIKALWDRVEEMESQNQGKHLVNLGRISKN